MNKVIRVGGANGRDYRAAVRYADRSHLELTSMGSAKKMRFGAELPSRVSVAHAKAHLSALLTEVESKHGAVTILRRGVPVAQIVPFPEKPRPALRGSMRGTVKELGDIVGPTGEEWTLSDEEWPQPHED